MSRLPNDFQTYNSFQIINGGRGGDGGVGVTQGQGGGGGTGEAPALNYDINSENFTMNFLLQDRWPQNVSIGLLPASPPEIGMTLEGERGRHRMITLLVGVLCLFPMAEAYP
ncbi:hypothetical protein B0H14DRAFT_3438677 [Mycena olivaceomarginata]|nr:hypothetical protein B0H14DRAFT_3438677 [Mycena olivaceomarginata]